MVVQILVCLYGGLGIYLMPVQMILVAIAPQCCEQPDALLPHIRSSTTPWGNSFDFCPNGHQIILYYLLVHCKTIHHTCSALWDFLFYDSTSNRDILLAKSLLNLPIS